MSWTLRLPRTPTERLASRVGVRLGSFFPLLAWSGSEWALDPPAPQLETWTSPVADFDVKIAVPKGMSVFASGANLGHGRWHAAAVRDFALEAGSFKVARRIVHVPSPVVVTVAAASKYTYLPTYLNAAARALTTFSQRYGAYPWRTYTVVVEADRSTLGDEYPTLVFISTDLGSNVVTHETAHQWFYSLVGNNQARDPWLDESLAEWATARLSGAVATEAATDIPGRGPEPPRRADDVLGAASVHAGRIPRALLPRSEGPRVVRRGRGRRLRAATLRPRQCVPNCGAARLACGIDTDLPNAEAMLTGFGARF